MDRDTIKKLAHALKGAPLSCLFVMLSDDTAWGTLDLAEVTGYGRKTVGQGLEKLKELNLAQSHRRFNGWTLTNEGYQLAIDLNPQNQGLLKNGHEGENLPDEGSKLPLVIEGSKLPDEGSKLPLNGSKLPLDQRSSSSFKESYDSLNNKELLLLEHEGSKLPNEGSKLPLDLIEMLTKNGCYPELAEKSIKAALKQGDIEQIKTAITEWLEYCASPTGKSIKNPGVVTAKRIEAGIGPPKPNTSEEENNDDDVGEIQWIN